MSSIITNYDRYTVYHDPINFIEPPFIHPVNLNDICSTKHSFLPSVKLNQNRKIKNKPNKRDTKDMNDWSVLRKKCFE